LVIAGHVLLESVNKLIPQADGDQVPHLINALQVAFIMTAISLAESVIVQTVRILAPRITTTRCLSKSQCCPNWPPTRNIDRSIHDIVRIEEHGSAIKCTKFAQQHVTIEERGNELMTDLHAGARSNDSAAAERAPTYNQRNQVWRRVEYVTNLTILLVYIALIAYYLDRLFFRELLDDALCGRIAYYSFQLQFYWAYSSPSTVEAEDCVELLNCKHK
jgi:hypothetical protein